MQTVSRNELVWVAAWTLGIVVFSAVPYLIAWWLSPSGYVFTGMLMNPLDNSAYLAKMHQATQGAWLLHLTYTSEPHPAALLYPQYVVLGKLVALTGVPAPVLFHAARAAMGVLLLGMAYAFTAEVVTDRDVRKTAFLLLATSSGLTWLTSFWGLLASDATIPESNTFNSILTNVHFPLATGLFLLVGLLMLRSFPQFRRSRMVLGGLVNALLALLQPFLLVSQAAIGLLWGLLLVRKGAAARHLMRPTLLLPFLIPAIPVAMLIRQLSSDPILAQWMAQNVALSPPPWSYLAGYGLLAPLALAGLVAVWRRPEATGFTVTGGMLLAAWVLAGALLLYLPVPWQRRLSEGYHIPLSIMAAGGLHGLLLMTGLSEAARRRVRAGVIGFALVGSLWLAGTAVLGARVLLEPHYLTHADAAALAWLGDNARTSDIVLAAPTMGNLIPTRSSARVYWGHPFETVDADAKKQQIEHFYLPATTAAERCDFLREAGITLVYDGPVERRLGKKRLERGPGLEPVFRGNSVTIYNVVPPCARAPDRAR